MQINFHIQKLTDKTGTKMKIKLFSGKQSDDGPKQSPKTFVKILTAIVITVFSLICVLFYTGEKMIHTEITHQYESVENPNKFNSDCYFDEEYYSTYAKEDISNAAKLLYSKTGIQYYHISLMPEKQNCKTEEEVNNYIKEWMLQNIQNPEYALIRLETPGFVAGINEHGNENYIGSRREFITGEKAGEFFDYEAITLLKECYEKYGCDWDSEKLGKCFEKFIDETINYESKQTQKTIKIIVMVIFGIGAAAGVIAYVLYRKYTEDTIRILNTDIDDLEEEALKDKYLNSGKNNEKDEDKT